MPVFKNLGLISKFINQKLAWVLFLFLLFCGYSCDSPKTLNKQNLSNLYKKNNDRINPSFLVYHTNSDESEIFVRIFTDKLQFAEDANANRIFCRVKVNYELYDSFSDLVPMDSASAVLEESYQPDKGQSLVSKLLVKASYPSTYVAKIEILDVFRNHRETYIIDINKSSFNSRQNFLVKEDANDFPKFSQHLKKGERVKIQSNQNELQKLNVRYYKPENSLPPPPFAIYNNKEFNFQADSIYVLFKNDSGFFEFEAPKPGIFHLVNSSGQKEGTTLLHFDNFFPEVKVIEDLIEPLRYITKKQEFDKIYYAENKKKAIDEFWLSISSSPARAKELIKEFYNRVEEANLYFSTYKKGWQTDRGLTYIVMGEPSVIYKDEMGETWIYGEEGSYRAVSLSFNKVEHPFSDNEFILSRSPIYKEIWYRSVDSWRDGRVLIK